MHARHAGVYESPFLPMQDLRELRIFHAEGVLPAARFTAASSINRSINQQINKSTNNK
jgi:hypothetical protein